MTFDTSLQEATGVVTEIVRRGQSLAWRLAHSDVLLAIIALGVLILIFFYDIIFLGRTLVTSSLLWGVMGTEPPFVWKTRPSNGFRGRSTYVILIGIPHYGADHSDDSNIP